MPYGIPKAWSPGLAIPQYIKDEGLQRHAFTTLEAPDGTYDNPPVGSGGYVVPNYVLTDGYGQGATGTKWSPRGSYYGPKIPSFLSKPANRIVGQRQLPGGATQFTVKNGAQSTTQGVGVSAALQGLGADDIPSQAMHSSYVAYGNNAATHLMNSVKKLAPGNRKPALKKILDTVDKSLWHRTTTISNRYLAQGVPPAQALHAGLARAMSTGFAAEIIHTGMKAQKPKARSLMGLGAYGHRAIYSALGDAASNAATITAAQGSSGAVATTVNADARIGICDSTNAFITDMASDGTIFWRRLKVGEQCSGTSTLTPTVTVHDSVCTADMTEDQCAALTATLAAPSPDVNSQVLQVGPFSIPLNVAVWTVHWSGKLPADWQAFILPEISTDCKNCFSTSMYDATPGHFMNNLAAFFDDGTLPPAVNNDLIGRQHALYDDASHTSYFEPTQPIAVIDRPDTTTTWGIYFGFSPVDASKPWDPTSNPYVAIFQFQPIQQGVWDWIKHILGVIVDVIGDALAGLAGLACDVLQTPAGVVGGAVVGGYVGGPTGAAAGIKGAQIGAAACAAPPPPPPVAPTTNWLLPLALFGGGILIVTMMGKHKKKPGGKTTHTTSRTTVRK